MSTTPSPPDDGIAALRSEHRSIEAALSELRDTGPKQARARKKLRKRVIEQLARHLDIEEQLLFPIAEQEAAAKPAVLKAREQHRVLKDLLNDLGTVEPQEETFSPKVEVLAEFLHAHIGEEQRSIMAPVAAALTVAQRRSLVERLREGRAALANPTDYLRSP